MHATANDAKASQMRRRRLIPAVAVLFAAGVAAAIAVAATTSTHTLRIKRDVHVTNTPTAAFRVKAVDTHEAVAVGPAGYAVYTFQGETTHHIICKKTSNPMTNCWAFWPPVSVSKSHGLSKPAGIHGHLGTFRIHGLRQLTLNGQPLYYFTPDLSSGNKRRATGDELKTYGSIWHIVVAHVGTAPSTSTTGTTTTGTTSTGTTTTGTSTTPTTPYPY
jgi:predicted lipoprotein with Yx(FWY)xxD motif